MEIAIHGSYDVIGCAELLQWGHDFAAVEILAAYLYSVDSIDHRFNGATTLQPWKCISDVGVMLQALVLQWGHDFAAVEIEYIQDLQISSFGFNGATTLQPWKYF